MSSSSSTRDSPSHAKGAKSWSVIAAMLLPSLAVLNLFKTSRYVCVVAIFTIPEKLMPTPAMHKQEHHVQHPLMIQMIKHKGAVAKPLDVNWTKKHKIRKRMNEGWIMNTDVRDPKPIPREVEQGCKLVGQSWARDYNPICNVVHEVGIRNLVGDSSGLDTSRIVGNGSNRDVWAVREYDCTQRVLKTVQMEKKFNDLSLFDRNRRDAVASEQLSKSPYIMNIYGHCGYSAIYDFSDGGELSEVFQGESNITKEELFQIAHDVATSVADAHNVDKRGRASIAHADIKPAQFLKVNGRYMLNDFNRARFLYYDPKQKRNCGFHVRSNGSGVWRSPEEYWMYPETEKIDVFSLGNVLYFLLTGNEPFQNEMPTSDAIELIKNGGHVSVSEELRSSTHLFDTTVLKALNMCFVYDPMKRATAREVANLFRQAIEDSLSLER